MTTRTPASSPTADRRVAAPSAATAPDDERRLHRLRIGDEEFIALSVATRRSTGDADVGLTAAEREIAQFVRDGLSNQAIAELRGGSVRTVANQVASVLRKHGVRSRAELVVRAQSAARTR